MAASQSSKKQEAKMLGSEQTDDRWIAPQVPTKRPFYMSGASVGYSDNKISLAITIYLPIHGWVTL